MRKQFLVTVKIQDISQAKRHFSEQSVQNDNRKLGAERTDRATVSFNIHTGALLTTLTTMKPQYRKAFHCYSVQTSKAPQTIIYRSRKKLIISFCILILF